MEVDTSSSEIQDQTPTEQDIEKPEVVEEKPENEEIQDDVIEEVKSPEMTENEVVESETVEDSEKLDEPEDMVNDDDKPSEMKSDINANSEVEMKDVSISDAVTSETAEDAQEAQEAVSDGVVNGDNEEENFLVNITLGKESNSEEVAANGEGAVESDNNKYTDKDAPRRVLIKNIDRKKTADDIEDYFFDVYSDAGIEDVFTCYLPGKKKWFNGAAIITFETEEQTQKFMKTDFKKEEQIGFRQKLYKICLADNKKKREERLKKFTEQKKKPEVNGVEPAVKTSSTIACVGFAGKVKGVSDVQSYMKENHENIVDVQIEKEKTLITFGDQRSADRFLGLTYVKFKGGYIHRRYSEEVKRGEKRKHESSDRYLGAVKGAQFKLRGFKSSGTNYTVIKQGLEGLGVEKNEIKFVNYDGGLKEAVVRLQTGKAREVVMMLNKAGLLINGDKVTGQVLVGVEEDAYLVEIGKAKWNARPKKEFKSKANDWSDY